MNYWKHWHPVILDCTTSTLAQIKSEMEGDEAVNFWVYLFENPQSPIALPGSTSLFTHDSLHIILRRGLLPQDEAFVIGFSMGTDTTTKPWHIKVFKFLATHLYPVNYKLSEDELKIFDLGFEYGRSLITKHRKNLHRYPFKKYQNKTIKTICSEMGITIEALNEYREKEKQIIPHSNVSKRLNQLTEQSLEEDMNERESNNILSI